MIIFHNHNKIALSILCLLLIFSCEKDNQAIEAPNSTISQNGVVPLDVAKAVALNFFQKSQSIGKGKIMSTRSATDLVFEKKIIATKTIQEKTKKKNLFFIVNFKPSGFAIVSATNKHEPILAYSETGNFDYDKAQYGVKDWLEGMSNKINHLIKTDALVDSASIAQWGQLTARDAPSIDEEITIQGPPVEEKRGPLLSTTWGQGVGYNDGIPTSYGCNISQYSNGKPPIGCVATAIGQITKYWRIPTNMNWSNMPNAGGGGSIPGLLYTIAEVVNMNYQCEGSGATMEKARHAFGMLGYITNFSDYNEGTVTSELNNNRPIILSGNDPNKTAGHAWVCDGYKRTVYITIHNPNTRYEYTTGIPTAYLFHMNWGWGSDYYNGYYTSYNFNSSNGSYNNNVKMITNIRPK